MKKKLMVIGALFMAVAVTLSSVSGTYAKYTSAFADKTSTATVAKWNVKFGSNDGTFSESTTFGLFDTIVDTVDGNADDDVKNGLIAPGTKGSFNLAIQSNNEVNAKYTLTLELTNANNIPIEFSTNGTDWISALDDDFNTNFATMFNATDTAIPMGEQSIVVPVQWRWAFERGTGDTLKANNLADTTIGEITSDTTVSVKANITVVQVD